MDGKKETAGQGVLIGLSIVVAVYFFCPFVLVLPLLALEKLGVPRPTLEMAATILVAPIEKLDRSVPLYHSLLEKEKDAFSGLFGEGV